MNNNGKKPVRVYTLAVVSADIWVDEAISEDTLSRRTIDTAMLDVNTRDWTPVRVGERQVSQDIEVFDDDVDF